MEFAHRHQEHSPAKEAGSPNYGRLFVQASAGLRVAFPTPVIADPVACDFRRTAPVLLCEKAPLNVGLTEGPDQPLVTGQPEPVALVPGWRSAGSNNGPTGV